MHYNLNEKLKPKRHTPVKKIVFITVLVVLGVLAYFVLSHTFGGQNAPA